VLLHALPCLERDLHVGVEQSTIESVLINLPSLPRVPQSITESVKIWRPPPRTASQWARGAHHQRWHTRSQERRGEHGDEVRRHGEVGSRGTGYGPPRGRGCPCCCTLLPARISCSGSVRLKKALTGGSHTSVK
jgi:hypothetical protein